MKNTKFIRSFITVSLLTLIAGAAMAVSAAPIVRYAVSGTAAGDITPTVNQFRSDLGGANNGTGNSYATGRREINWDDVPENMCQGSSGDLRTYYNTTAPRGIVITDSTYNRCSLTPNFGGANEVARFGDINPNYRNYFSSYTLYRIFAPGSTQFDILFFVPGTNTPATVNGFGIVFLDKDVLETGIIIFYDQKGEEITRQIAQNNNNGLSFIGASFNDGTRIARVRVIAGNTPISNGASESNQSSVDVVAIDDIIYGEPRAIGQHSSDFDGDGTSDLAVFRPSNGTWYFINSGSNTFSAAQFGTNGDVPVDGDFDGDSRSDFAVFRPSNGTWYFLRSSNSQFQGIQFGLSGDKPVAADYDKDGKSDIAVWRPSTGTYYYLKSSNGQFAAAQFGVNGDIPIGASAP